MKKLEGYAFVATQMNGSQQRVSRMFGPITGTILPIVTYQNFATNGLQLFQSKEEMILSAETFRKSEYPAAEIKYLQISLSIPEKWWDNFRLNFSESLLVVWEAGDGQILVGDSGCESLLFSRWSEFPFNLGVFTKKKSAKMIARDLRKLESGSTTKLVAAEYALL